MGVRLAEQVFRLVDLVGGVHRHQDRADLGGGPEGDEPGGHVGGPDGDLVPLLHPQGDQGPGELVHVVPELGIGASIVQGGELEGVLIREFLHHPVQHLGEGLVDDQLLLPGELARVGRVLIEGGPGTVGVVESGHEVDIMRKNDLQIVDLRHPGGVPLQGEEAVVVDAAQGVHHDAQGHIPLAHQPGLHHPVHHDAVPHMDVAHISAQVLDGLVRRLAAHPVGVLEIPQHRQVVAGEIIQHVPQPAGVGKDAHGLDEHGDARLLGQGLAAAQTFDQGVRHFAAGGGVDADIGYLELAGGLDAVRDLPAVFFQLVPVGNVADSVYAGEAEPRFIELPQGGGSHVGVEGTAPGRQGSAVDVPQLDALELHFLGRADIVRPGIAFPALDGKGELHCTASS